jgi:hypothetical protein
MKRIIFLLTFIAFSLIHFKTNSQTNWCGDFSITGITNDSIDPNILQISIAFSASTSTFANYPYISAIIDCQGDTVATGNMFWFGQFGQSTIDYPVLSNGTSPCEPYTAIFLYSDNSGLTDTCFLNSNGTNSLDNEVEQSWRIYPNPAEDVLLLQLPQVALGAELQLMDITGKLMLEKHVSELSMSINISEIPRGTYFIRLKHPLNPDVEGIFHSKLSIH